MIRALTPFLVVLSSSAAYAEQPRGFRTGGTGRYPNAKPPLEWGPDKNVVWKIDLPQSNAIPVILGDRLFTCAEPCVLLCVDKRDGRILWQGESSYQEIQRTAEEERQYQVERKQAEALDEKLSALERESSALRKAQQDGTAPKEETEEKQKSLRTQIEALRKEKKQLTTWYRFQEPGKGGGNYHRTGGLTSPTPVTDGEHVYALFGNGLAACYNLDGERQWLKLVEQPTAPNGHGSSPMLFGDRLLVHFTDLVALDTKDGGEAWRVKVSPGHGTSMHARLGDVDVAIHPSGNVYRLRDGELLASGLGSAGPNSPLVQEGKLFFAAGQELADALPTSSEIPARWTHLWKSVNLKGGGYWFPSPILHDGLLYAMNAGSIFTIVDAKTGEKVDERRLDFGGGQSYPSLTLAGDYLFASSDNGTTIVFKPGRDCEEVARNELEPFRSSLVFEGERLYVRTTKGLWCLGK